MSVPLSRREVILTQLCSLRHVDTDLLSEANRLIPRILQVLEMEPTDPTELCNLILDSQISRTEIAMKTYVIYLSERKTSFRFFPVRGLWTSRPRGEAHLLIHLRGEWEDRDAVDMVGHSDLTRILAGPFTYVLTPPRPDADVLLERGVARLVREMFAPRDHDRIFRFLLDSEEA